MGTRPGSQVLGVHRARHPGALNSRLCPLCRLHCLRTEGLELPFPHHGHLHILDCIPAHDSLASSCSASEESICEERLERGGVFGTGILFSTSEPHGMPWWSWPSGPIPGTLRPPSHCMCHHHSEQQVPWGFRLPGLSVALGPCSSLSIRAPSDSCSGDFPLGVT